MDYFDARRWVDLLTKRVAEADRIYEIEDVRDQSVLLLEKIFGADSALVKQMSEVRPVQNLLMRAGRSRWRFRVDVERVLNNALFALDLDRKPDVGLETRGLRPSEPAVDRLREMVDDLVGEIGAADLAEADRQQLLTILSEARRLLNEIPNPDIVRSDLEILLGQSVAKAARPGAAKLFWRRVAELIVVAEAAFSLGTGLVALQQSKPAELRVECNLEAPALPPVTDPIDQATPHAPRELPPPRTPTGSPDS